MDLKSINLSLNVPQDKQIIQQAIANLYVGLDKATIKGVFNLKEAGQLCTDLDVIAKLFTQINAVYENQDKPK